MLRQAPNLSRINSDSTAASVDLLVFLKEKHVSNHLLLLGNLFAGILSLVLYVDVGRDLV